MESVWNGYVYIYFFIIRLIYFIVQKSYIGYKGYWVKMNLILVFELNILNVLKLFYLKL